MAEKVVELRKTLEEQPPVAAQTRPSRVRLRVVLLVIIPLIALAGGLYLYLTSGATFRPTMPTSARRRCSSRRTFPARSPK
jgi:hypothetical protein